MSSASCSNNVSQHDRTLPDVFTETSRRVESQTRSIVFTIHQAFDLPLHSRFSLQVNDAALRCANHDRATKSPHRFRFRLWPLSGQTDRHQQRLLDTSTAIRNSPPDRINFLHAVQCQGLPYGEKPRLVLIHLATEAVRTGTPVVDVEDSMTAFARSLGLETNGQQLRSLKDQLARLAAATVRMGVVEDGRAIQVNTQFVSAFDLWFPKQADQRVLWPSTVRLSQEYFQSLGQHAVPLDHRAVGALASSSMALDIYVWLAQRLHRVPAGKPQFVGWASLHEQFGQGFNRIRDFRRRFLQTLHQVSSAYPAARMSADDRGMTLSYSPPPVAPRPTGTRFTSRTLTP